MHARVATFDDVDLDGIDEVVEWANEHGREITDTYFLGYEGGLALLDRDNHRIIEINLFDTEAHARAADVVLDRGFPPEMPDDIKAILKRSSRRSKGVFEVLAGEGRAASLA